MHDKIQVYVSDAFNLQAGRWAAGGCGCVWFFPLCSDPGQAGQSCATWTGTHCQGESVTHRHTQLPVLLIRRVYRKMMRESNYFVLTLGTMLSLRI